MKIIVSRSLMSIIAIVIIAGGCSKDHWASHLAKPGTMRERIRNAPGRTGILTEKKRYSLFDEELIIRDFFQDRKGGFFVDVGCAWPIKSNNTYYLEKHLGWTGIGIDALNDYAAQWKEKRPNSKFFNFLVTENSEGSGRFYKSGRMGLSSTNQKLANGSQFPRGNRAKTEEIQVPKVCLNDLFDREGIKKIDLLALDIEDHELKALAGLDLERFSPELIVVETGFDFKGELTKYLTKHGYQKIQRYEPFDEVNTYYCRKQEPVDADGDGIPDSEDNCPNHANGPNRGTCTQFDGVNWIVSTKQFCTVDADCDLGEFCEKIQADNYPLSGNGIGDACDCESDFLCDGDVDSDDMTAFLDDFGREPSYRRCGHPTWGACDGDFNCDVDVDSDDVEKFLEDFGREASFRPCPPCDGSAWCAYP